VKQHLQRWGAVYLLLALFPGHRPAAVEAELE
jgi:hypothetical protein